MHGGQEQAHHHCVTKIQCGRHKSRLRLRSQTVQNCILVRGVALRGQDVLSVSGISVSCLRRRAPGYTQGRRPSTGSTHSLFSMVSSAEMKLVKESLPRFERHGYDVAVELYREVFKVDSNLRALFSLEFLAPKTQPNAETSTCPFAGQDSLELPLSMQARILSQTIVSLASKIDNLSSEDRAIDRICCKHVSRDIRAEHYGVVAAAFDTAMRTVLKDDLSAEEFAAWGSAIGALAEVFIARETAIREAAGAKTGGWVGFRKFVIGKQPEIINAGAKLLLVPVDNGHVCPAGKGQYSCLRMNVENFGTIYHNTFLKSEARPEETAETHLRCKDPGGSANRLAALAIMAPQKRGSCSRLAPNNSGSSSRLAPNNSAVGDDSTEVPVYGTVISTTLARPQPFPNDPSLSEIFVTPGRLISQHATEGAVVELSVPVGGYSSPGMNEAEVGKHQGKSLLRNTLDKGGSKLSGSPLLRQVAVSEARGLKSQMGGASPVRSISSKTSKSREVNKIILDRRNEMPTYSEEKSIIDCPAKSIVPVDGKILKTGECQESNPKPRIHNLSSKRVVDSSVANEYSACAEKLPSPIVESELSPTNVIAEERL